jgi:hypothetical protein
VRLHSDIGLPHPPPLTRQALTVATLEPTFRSEGQPVQYVCGHFVGVREKADPCHSLDGEETIVKLNSSPVHKEPRLPAGWQLKHRGLRT